MAEAPPEDDESQEPNKAASTHLAAHRPEPVGLPPTTSLFTAPAALPPPVPVIRQAFEGGDPDRAVGEEYAVAYDAERVVTDPHGESVVGGVKRVFGGPEAAKIVGISYRQLDHWARKGLVKPSLAPARGSGTQRQYSYADLLELKVIKSLRDAGLSLQRIEKAFEYIRGHLTERAAELRIFSDGSNVYACRSNDEVISLLDRGQVVFGFALGRIAADLDGSIAEISPSAAADMSRPDVRVVEA